MSSLVDSMFFGVVALTLLVATSARADVFPYDLPDGWSYWLEAVRAEPWPACPYRFLSFDNGAVDGVVNLWSGAGANQLFVLEPAAHDHTPSRVFFLRANGTDRYLAASKDCTVVTPQLLPLMAGTASMFEWEATAASDQPGHFALRALGRSLRCAETMLGFAARCGNAAGGAPDPAVLTAAQNASSWRAFPVAPAAPFEQPPATTLQCPDPFVWLPPDEPGQLRMVCTFGTSLLGAAAPLTATTQFTPLGVALGGTVAPWAAGSQIQWWAPENKFVPLAGATTAGRGANFLLWCAHTNPTANATEINHVGYSVSYKGPNNETYTDYAATPLVLSQALGGDIDPHVFVDPVTNKTYLVWKSDDNGVGMKYTRIWSQEVAFHADNGTIQQLSSPQVIMTSDGLWWAPSFIAGGTLVEAPEMLYRDGYYYLFFAAGHYCGVTYSEGVARSLSPLGPFEKLMVPLVSTGMMGQWKGQPLQGPGHAAVVPVGDGKYFLVLHAHTPGPYCVRLPYVMPLDFNDGGWPVVVVQPSS